LTQLGFLSPRREHSRTILLVDAAGTISDGPLTASELQDGLACLPHRDLLPV